MVGLGHAHRRLSLSSNRSSTEEPRPDSAGGDDETVVEPDQGNVLSHIISQLRPGADLSRVVLPTFILEPRSMLERITNFMQHPETLLPMPHIDDPLQRFVSVVKFYLSGWHIKPPGVKKPLNPILGEYYTCYWDLPDGTQAYYIAEQTSHHPPKSSYFYMAPDHHIRIDGTLKPRSKFLGNSAASLMEGTAILQFLNRGKDKDGERYILTQPNMYARGILFGKMKYELGDHSFVRCPENNLVADIEFKTKGYFSGTYNAIGGVIRNERTQEVFYELSGTWNGEMYIKDSMTGHKELVFDASHAKHTPPTTRPLEEQGPRESQRLWQKVVAALKERNHDVATDEKTRIEDMQREEAAKRAEDGVDWHPHFFRPVHGGPGGSEEGEEDIDWILNAEIDGPTPKEQRKQILAVAPILPGSHPSQKNNIPPQHQSGNHQRQPSLPQAQPAAAPSSTTNNQSNPSSKLIDFDDGDSVPTPTATSTSSHPSIANSQQQASPSHLSSQSSLSQSAGLQQPLQPTQQQQALRPAAASSTQNSSFGSSSGAEDAAGSKVTRKDTNSGSEEEFVDADDGFPGATAETGAGSDPTTGQRSFF